MAIGSGGHFAQSAARALLDHTDLSAKDIVEKGLTIVGDIWCTLITTSPSKNLIVTIKRVR